MCEISHNRSSSAPLNTATSSGTMMPAAWQPNRISRAQLAFQVKMAMGLGNFVIQSASFCRSKLQSGSAPAWVPTPNRVQPYGVERLRQIQPTGRSAFRAEDGHIRVGCNLQHGEAQSDNEKSAKKQRIRKQRRRRPEQCAAGRGNQQPDDAAILHFSCQRGRLTVGASRDFYTLKFCQKWGDPATVPLFPQPAVFGSTEVSSPPRRRELSRRSRGTAPPCARQGRSSPAAESPSDRCRQSRCQSPRRG